MNDDVRLCIETLNKLIQNQIPDPEAKEEAPKVKAPPKLRRVK